jgi:hypothetical protein
MVAAWQSTRLTAQADIGKNSNKRGNKDPGPSSSKQPRGKKPGSESCRGRERRHEPERQRSKIITWPPQMLKTGVPPKHEGFSKLASSIKEAKGEEPDSGWESHRSTKRKANSSIEAKGKELQLESCRGTREGTAWPWQRPRTGVRPEKRPSGNSSKEASPKQRAWTGCFKEELREEQRQAEVAATMEREHHQPDQQEDSKGVAKLSAKDALQGFSLPLLPRMIPGLIPTMVQPAGVVKQFSLQERDALRTLKRRLMQDLSFPLTFLSASVNKRINAGA